VTDNLLESKEGLKYNLYREFDMGTKINLSGLLLLYVDPHLIPNLPREDGWGFEAGAELAIFSEAFIRAGWFRNARLPAQNDFGDGFGFGAGFVAPRISLDYGLSRNLKSMAGLPNTTEHVIGATIYF
jgi:hypothetical protein